MTMHRVFVIAEAGVNHNGSLDLAFRWSKRRAQPARTRSSSRPFGPKTS